MIDHVVMGVAELTGGAVALEARTGLASLEGGRHVGRGTANRIVPLGRGYLELLAVVDTDEASRSSWGSWARSAGRGLIAWCVAVADLDAVCARLGLVPAEWSRLRPDGVQLRWRLAGVEQAVEDPLLPFFIEWHVPPGLHPQALDAPHRVAPAGIARLDLTGDEDRLRDWLGGVVVPVAVTPGPSALRALTVSTADGGEVVIT